MTTIDLKDKPACPVEGLLKLLSGKWKLRLFQMATRNPLRFNSLLRELPGSNKQSLSAALKDLEKEGLIIKKKIQEKPLHIEYHISEKGITIIPILHELEVVLAKINN